MVRGSNLGEARFFAPVQTGSGAHPASCTMGTNSCTSIKSAIKIITVTVELKSYSETEDINSIKSWVCALGKGGGGGHGVKLAIFQ